ncbi:hypothetical protein ACJX0J_019001, partial [Zea mays]
SDLCCGRFGVVGRPGLHQSVLVLTCFADCSSPGPRKNGLTIYWIFVLKHKARHLVQPRLLQSPVAAVVAAY